MMNHIRKRPLVCILMAVGLAAASTTVAAQSAPPSSPATATAPVANSQQQQARDVRASRLIGSDVRNTQGENLGKVHDLVLDVTNGRVHYAVLEFGGFLGIGEKYFAYPVSALRQTTDSDQLLLNVNRNTLKNAPGFDKDRWPDWSDARQRNVVDQFYGGRETVAANPRFVRASELIDRDVNDRNGRDAGEIEDVVVSLATGQVRYVVMEFDRAWNPNDKLVALPVASIQAPAAKSDDVVLSLTRDQIDMTKGFDDDALSNVNEQRFRQTIDEQLNTYHNVIGQPGTR